MLDYNIIAYTYHHHPFYVCFSMLARVRRIPPIPLFQVTQFKAFSFFKPNFLISSTMQLLRLLLSIPSSALILLYLHFLTFWIQSPAFFPLCDHHNVIALSALSLLHPQLPNVTLSPLLTRSFRVTSHIHLVIILSNLCACFLPSQWFVIFKCFNAMICLSLTGALV